MDPESGKTNGENSPPPQDEAQTMRTSAEAVINETLSGIRHESELYARQGKRLKWLNSTFNVSTVILSVAAPAFVTYQTQQTISTHNEWLVLASILLVAVGGASATLRGVLRWSERYGYTIMTALRLRELESVVDLQRQDIANTTQEQYVFGKLSELNKEAQKKRIEIIRSQLESELAIVEKAEKEGMRELELKTLTTPQSTLPKPAPTETPPTTKPVSPIDQV